MVVGGDTEVETPVGFIDVLSDTEVIEVKYYKKWKHGLGQVLAYQSFYPRLEKRLHLFAHKGDLDTGEIFAFAKSVCDEFSVVTFEEIRSGDDDEARVGVKRSREDESERIHKRRVVLEE